MSTTEQTKIIFTWKVYILCLSLCTLWELTCSNLNYSISMFARIVLIRQEKVSLFFFFLLSSLAFYLKSLKAKRVKGTKKNIFSWKVEVDWNIICRYVQHPQVFSFPPPRSWNPNKKRCCKCERGFVSKIIIEKCFKRIRKQRKEKKKKEKEEKKEVL